MKRLEMNRRDFTKLTVAAFGGVVAGTAIGCGGQEDAAKTTPAGVGAGTAETDPAGGPDETPADGGTEGKTTEVALNACRGLNGCQNQGKGEHACAGQGNCATVAAHDCAGKNTCKNLGGCHGKAGTNACEAMGGCAVPMEFNGDAWTAAREAFEERMKAADKAVGAAPEA